MSTQGLSEPAIGIFDSGVGGLTVAHAIHKLLPTENLLYVGDTAHHPYGEKSPKAISHYALSITDYLMHRGCKIILIACNSAASAASEQVKQAVGANALVIDVIDPVIEYLANLSFARKVGIIGTKQTIRSKIYEHKIQQAQLPITALTHATPLLASMIDEGFADSRIIDDVLATYLAHPTLDGIDTLVLGCTHYPLIENKINAYYKGRVNIIDSSEIVAKHIKKLLESLALTSHSASPTHEFYITDPSDSFRSIAAMFFGAKLSLTHLPLWPVESDNPETEQEEQGGSSDEFREVSPWLGVF